MTIQPETTRCCLARFSPSLPAFLVALSWMGLGGPETASGEDSQTVQIEKDVEYLEPGRLEKADLYLPANLSAGKHPAVVIIHGGGWTGGDKGAKREINIGTNLAARGYVGMSINYVLATKESATWPRNLHDCKTAERDLRPVVLGFFDQHLKPKTK